MPSVTWDAAFEASPADVDEAKYGATKIRQLKTAISERLELEQNFKTGTQPLGKAGKASVIFYGTTADITALSGMSQGAWAWDTTLKVLKYYTGSVWIAVDIDHGSLSGLADDDHPQYYNLTKAGQTITESLLVTALKTIDGRDISVDGAKLDTLTTGSWLGAWVAKAVDTIYQAATDGFVIAMIDCPTSSDRGRLDGYTDSAATPTTKRCACEASLQGLYNMIQVASIMMPVKKNDYWKMTKTTDAGTPTYTVYWIPLGA
jgi:hypothetical protein